MFKVAVEQTQPARFGLQILGQGHPAGQGQSDGKSNSGHAKP